MYLHFFKARRSNACLRRGKTHGKISLSHPLYCNAKIQSMIMSAWHQRVKAGQRGLFNLAGGSIRCLWKLIKKPQQHTTANPLWMRFQVQQTAGWRKIKYPHHRKYQLNSSSLTKSPQVMSQPVFKATNNLSMKENVCWYTLLCVSND